MTLFHHGSQTPGNTFKPVYNDPVYSGHPVYYGHRTTSQNFQWPYVFYKVDLYIKVVTLYNNSHLAISLLYTGLTVHCACYYTM